jgi:hypothetical protein
MVRAVYVDSTDLSSTYRAAITWNKTGSSAVIPWTVPITLALLGEIAMKGDVKDRPSKRLRVAATAIVTCGLMAAGAAHANASDKIVLVPQTDLPALALQAGEAMFLHDTIDGRTLLYIEQNQGARLATFDVTDPVHIIGKGSVRLDASRPFDFVSPLGDYPELVRYRQSHDDAVLDLPRTKDPQLKTVPGLTINGAITSVGSDEFAVSGQAVMAITWPSGRWGISSIAQSRIPHGMNFLDWFGCCENWQLATLDDRQVN